MAALYSLFLQGIDFDSVKQDDIKVKFTNFIHVLLLHQSINTILILQQPLGCFSILHKIFFLDCEKIYTCLQ